MASPEPNQTSTKVGAGVSLGGLVTGSRSGSHRGFPNSATKQVGHEESFKHTGTLNWCVVVEIKALLDEKRDGQVSTEASGWS